MTIYKTKSGNFATIMNLNRFQNVTAVVYFTPAGMVLNVKPHDIDFVKNFTVQKDCSEITVPTAEQAEDTLSIHYEMKISSGNPGSAIVYYDMLKPHDKVRVMKEIVFADDEEGFDLADFFEFLYKKGRDDVAEALLGNDVLMHL